METTQAVILSQVAFYIGSKLLDGSLEALGSELSKGAIGWIKSLFFKEDNSPKEVLEDLKNDPDVKVNRDAVEILLAKTLRKDPNAEQWVQEIHALLQKQANAGDKISIDTIKGNNNVVGSTFIGSNVNIGNRNT